VSIDLAGAWKLVPWRRIAGDGTVSCPLGYNDEVQGDTVAHRIDVSLFPNWSGAEQSRPFTGEYGELVLRTPPMATAAGTSSTSSREL
jgi:hypothetical protein